MDGMDGMEHIGIFGTPFPFPFLFFFLKMFAIPLKETHTSTDITSALEE